MRSLCIGGSVVFAVGMFALYMPGSVSNAFRTGGGSTTGQTLSAAPMSRARPTPPAPVPTAASVSTTATTASASTTMLQDCDPYGAMGPVRHPDRNFYFTRARYSSGLRGFRGGNSWSIDWPKADLQFLYVMERTLGWDIYPCDNWVDLDDPDVRNFPFIYLLEVGDMSLTPPEVEGFRNYLLAGGFALIDDFWGPYAWDNFVYEIRRVLPEYDIVDIPMDHLLFRIVYPIEEVLQVPNRGNGQSGNPQLYGECGFGSPCTPTVRGIFDEEGRLMVLIAHNTDLGDAWEWAEQPDYPWDRSNYAFQLAFNVITYAMTF